MISSFFSLFLNFYRNTSFNQHFTRHRIEFSYVVLDIYREFGSYIIELVQIHMSNHHNSYKNNNVFFNGLEKVERLDFWDMINLLHRKGEGN